VLLAGVHAALQPLGRPAERRQHPVGQACPLGHIWVVAGDVQAGVVQPAGAQQQLAVERPAAGQPLGDRELALAVPLHRAGRSCCCAQRLQGRLGGRGGGQRVGVHSGESRATAPVHPEAGGAPTGPASGGPIAKTALALQPRNPSRKDL
jgi:hypothetical protein